MAMDPRLPSNLFTDLTDLERRVRALERNSVTGKGTSALTGGVIIYGPDGDIISRMGVISDDFGSGADAQGLEVGINPTGYQANTWLRVSEGGVELPHIPISWAQDNEYKAITSGTFVNAWLGGVNALSTRYMAGQITVSADAATTGEIRFGSSGGGWTDTKSVPGGVSTNYFLTWTLPGAYVLGSGPHTFVLQARRASGAGNVYIYSPIVSFGRDANTNSTGWT